MKLTEQAITSITQATKLKLALALGFTELWVSRLIEANKDNGPLTTVASLNVLREETGLSDEEILEESTKVAV